MVVTLCSNTVENRKAINLQNFTTLHLYSKEMEEWEIQTIVYVEFVAKYHVLHDYFVNELEVLASELGLSVIDQRST